MGNGENYTKEKNRGEKGKEKKRGGGVEKSHTRESIKGWKIKRGKKARKEIKGQG